MMLDQLETDEEKSVALSLVQKIQRRQLEELDPMNKEEHEKILSDLDPEGKIRVLRAVVQFFE